MEKIRVIQQACIGCGSCAAICPDVFEMNDEGFSEVKDGMEVVTDELRNDMMDALEGCPTSAIEIYEDKEDNKN